MKSYLSPIVSLLAIAAVSCPGLRAQTTIVEYDFDNPASLGNWQQYRGTLSLQDDSTGIGTGNAMQNQAEPAKIF